MNVALLWEISGRKEPQIVKIETIESSFIIIGTFKAVFTVKIKMTMGPKSAKGVTSPYLWYAAGGPAGGVCVSAVELLSRAVGIQFAAELGNVFPVSIQLLEESRHRLVDMKLTEDLNES